MDIPNTNTFGNVKILMLKGEKGDKGEGSYDDTEVKGLIVAEARERGREDASINARLDNLVAENTTNMTGWDIVSVTANNITAVDGVASYEFHDIPDGAVIIEAFYKLTGYNPWVTSGLNCYENFSALGNSIALQLNNASAVYSYTFKLVYAYSDDVHISELEDIRVGVDGTVYDSAGEAVRTQIENVSGGGDGLTDAAKQALLAIARKVAYIDDQGETYYQALFDALYPTNLVSISAAFTQGSNVVYDTDSLDSLKSMLVVTATYDDETTETVADNDYTLSGTLTAGTSIITVTYSGKTTTFNVTVAGVVLPEGYTRYDYIKTTVGNGSHVKERWIILNDQTNLSALKTRIILAKNNSPTADSAFLGVRNDSGAETSYGFYLTKDADGGGVAVWLNGVKTYSAIGFSAGYNKNILEVDPKTSSPGSIVLNDESAAINYSNTVIIPHGFVLFTNPKYDGSVNMSLNTPAILGDIVLIDSTGNIVGYYVPAVYNNQIGMYDGVSQQFYTSSNASYTTIGNSNCLYAVGNWS